MEFSNQMEFKNGNYLNLRKNKIKNNKIRMEPKNQSP